MGARRILGAALGLIAVGASLAQVPYQRIVNADEEPGNWLTYSRDYTGQRYSKSIATDLFVHRGQSPNLGP